jgi:hypothetical protein
VARKNPVQTRPDGRELAPIMPWRNLFEEIAHR